MPCEVALADSRGTTDTSWPGRNWQARRMGTGALTRRSVSSSPGEGGGKLSKPRGTRMTRPFG